MLVTDKHLKSEHRLSVGNRLEQHRHIAGNGCWEWTGHLSKGYGRMRVGNGMRLVHRMAYELYCSPVPEDKTLDHLCRNRACFNPNHPEIVPFRVNVLRGNGASARNERKQACANGHPYVAGAFILEQTGNGRFGRRCIICRRAREKRNYHVGH